MKTRFLIYDHRPDHFRQGFGSEFPSVEFLYAETRDEALRLAGGAQGIFALGDLFDDELLAAAPELRWIQVLTTGTDAVAALTALGPGVIVTSGRGIHGPQMSEMAFLHMLVLTHDYGRMFRNQQAGVWERWSQPLLWRKTATILGVGTIAGTLARCCKTFGMTVYGISRTVREVENFDRIYPWSRMKEAVGLADYFIVLVPLSPETHKIVDAELIAAMKPTAYLINLARGGVMDEDALMEAVRSRAIAGAGLDVFAVEPLPGNHPLWSLENVTITPKLGGMSDVYVEQVMPLVKHNIRCFLAGDYDEMKNRVPLRP